MFLNKIEKIDKSKHDRNVRYVSKRNLFEIAHEFEGSTTALPHRQSQTEGGDVGEGEHTTNIQG